MLLNILGQSWQIQGNPNKKVYKNSKTENKNSCKPYPNNKGLMGMVRSQLT